MARKLFRRTFGKALATAATALSLPTVWSGTASAFNDGDRVTPTTALNTRYRPGTESRILATISPGTEGEIMNGPVTEDGYTWWGVHWLDDDIWGWSVERYLTTEPFSDDLFTLGVASGDPLPTAVVLWTRLAPNPLETDGGMPDNQVSVQWQVATDETMDNVVKRGTADAHPEHIHSIHVDVQGLEPSTEYYYRFTVDSTHSPIGRTKTAPAADASVEKFDCVFVSCQNYQQGYYTAHKHLSEEDLDVAIHLGDYIYEGGGQGSLGRGYEPPNEIKSLAEYRIRHAQHKTDPDLQAAHAAFPWIVTWDDHEVENNYADENDGAPPEEFLKRRAAAYQAYFEHMPLRPARRPDGPDLPLYRRFTFGELAEFNVLDTRQYRDDQTASVEEATNPDRTILGDEQERWLLDGLDSSASQWNVLAQQVPFAATDENTDPDVENFGAGDKWDGYRADRDTVRDFMTDHPALNPIVITGDVHRNYVYNIKADFSDPASKTVGTEYIGTSISSGGDGSGITSYGGTANEPYRRFYNNSRGYVRCTLTPQQWRTDYRVVSTVEQPTASVNTIASFVTDAGTPGAQLISERPPKQPIEITEIQANAPGSDAENLNGEFVTLRNTGSTAIDCSGFLLSFEGGRSQNYTFDHFTLGAGKTVTVRNGSGDDTQSTLYTEFTGAVLNNSTPDTVIIANDGGIVLDEESYHSGKFSMGDRVTPTTALNTRYRPGTESEILATMSPGTEGEIMNGPVDEDGYIWWGVHWLQDDIWGWSAGQYLTEV